MSGISLVYIFHFCTIDIQLTCFTVHTNLLRVNSNIYQNILPTFAADMRVFFRKRIDQEKFALKFAGFVSVSKGRVLLYLL